MPAVPLPQNPSLDKLRDEAKRLLRAARDGDPAAGAAIGDTHTLAAAQRAVARLFGFASWPRLKHHVDLVTAYTWRPESETGGDVADEFCRLACLTYTDKDSPARRERAARLLAERPDIVERHVWAAAAAGDAEAVARHLPHGAGRGGPYRWSPLFYLVYSRVGPADVEPIARMLLDAGADPHEGYLWNGLPCPFTLLTGCFGEGEQGPVAQPRHPRSIPLAALLLERGADPNDAQALYNRMFGTDDDHLELLLRHGLGRGDGGPWKARLGDTLQSPAQLIDAQLRWAVEHDQRARVALLAGHAADLTDAAHLAARIGNTALLRLLRDAGAPAPVLDPVDAYFGTAFAGDTPDPGLAEAARRSRPWMLVWAAATGHLHAVRTMLDDGFPPDARGRHDRPGEDPWETALHAAAWAGHRAVVALLLARGAARDVTDARFGATPAGWARHAGHDDIARSLERPEPA
ncbi:hypothetical protein Val02_78850 [Virgisporangium aliadipatigenens]|uniref:Ankyrin repeat domain-containing protein n=1 Tax=Virgisporangium aliadipatigenens TaxID=741659 RepID=A0A8J3YSQ6_9ACTN|nr:ankyrin repeat domain-containing protein [Virgisporangium aliadipatigenens]GIJ50999.1 hypothetical protein Val02_78850 [Virgisporangium aliadipatigenens]